MNTKDEILALADRVMAEAIRRGQSGLCREVMAVRDALAGRIPDGWEQELQYAEIEAARWGNG